MRLLPQDLMKMAVAEAGQSVVDAALEAMRRNRKQFRKQLRRRLPNPQADVFFYFLGKLRLTLSDCSDLAELRVALCARRDTLGSKSRALAKQATPKVSKSTVNRILAGDGVPRLSTLCGIADALQFPLEIKRRTPR